jgi:hypothetical protein
MGNTPHWFKCSKCKRTAERTGGILVARSGRPVLTGREKTVRKTSDGKLDQRAVEYRCEVCGFTGWTRHPSMIRRHDRA